MKFICSIICSNVIGVDLKDIQNASDTLFSYGDSYTYSFQKIKANSKRILDTLLLKDDLTLSYSNQLFCYFLNIFGENVVQYNYNSSYNHCCLSLIKAWRSFLEFYVLPGSSLKQYKLKKFGSNDNTVGSSSEFKGDDSSHNVGAMSPLVGDSFNASPLTMSKASNFSGDKRSYEIVTEIINHLSYHRNDGIINTDFGKYYK